MSKTIGMEAKKITGMVAKIINNNKLIINKGSLNGIHSKLEFFIYYNDEEIFDPETQESLGHLEIACGIGKPEHIQDRLTVIIPARYAKQDTQNDMERILFKTEPKLVPIAFKNLDKPELLFKVI